MQLGAPLIFGIIAALVARNKGYNWVYWFLALGLVGMIVIILMPDANRIGISSDEKAKIQKRGDLTGGILSAVSIVLILVSFVLIYLARPR